MSSLDTPVPVGLAATRKLDLLRRAAVVRLMLFGACAVLWGGCFSVMTVVTLDWLFDLPPAVRIFGACLFVLGFGLAVLHWIVRPWQRGVSIRQMARRVEGRFPQLGDRLTSLVCFVDAGEHDAMTRHVMADAESELASVPLRRVFTVGPLLRQLCLVALGMSLLLTSAWTSPEWLRTGAMRYVAPFAPYEWPRRVQIEPLTQVVHLARGESAILRMRVLAGQAAGLRGLLHLVDRSGRETILAMHRNADFEYRCVVDGLREHTTFWFSAGDNDTRKRSGSIFVLHRPTIVDATAHVGVPSYVDQSRRVEFDLLSSAARAVEGAPIDLVLISSKPAQAFDGTAGAWLKHDDGQVTPLVVDDGDRRRLTASLVATHSLTLTPHLIDADGLENDHHVSFRVQVEADRPPVVEIERPMRRLDVTKDATIPFAVRVSDDFGMTDVVLRRASMNDGDEPQAVSWLSEAVADDGDASTWRVETSCRIADWNVANGSDLRLVVDATDNFVSPDLRGQIGSSVPIHIRIISRAAVEQRLQASMIVLQRRMRSLMREQSTLRDELADSLADGDASRRPGALGDALDSQLRLNRRSARIAQQFRRVSENTAMALNSGDEGIQRVTELADRFGTLAGGRMRVVAEALAENNSESADRAMQGQRHVVSELRQIVAEMVQWQNEHSAVAGLRDQLDRQEALGRRVEAHAKSTAGRNVDQLDRDVRAQLDQTARMQMELADEVDAMLRRLQENTAGNADANSDILREAIASDLIRHMKEAGDAIGENRVAAARRNQRTAEEALLNMIASVERRASRRLARLSKRMAEDESVVADLLARQQTLADASREAFAMAVGGAVLDGFGRDQTLLSRNADHIAESMLERPETVEAADFVSDGADAMRGASDALNQRDADDCSNRQRHAITHLQQALEAIRQAKRETAHEAFKMAMAAVAEQLTAVVERQRSVNSRTEMATQMIRDAGQMTRRASREIRKITRSQKEIIESTSEMREAVERSIVFVYVLDEAMANMNDCIASLDRRRLDDTLQSRQARIVDSLSQLITALDDVQKLPPSDEFVSGGGGESGQRGSSEQGPPVPPVAELMMIKTMQSGLMNDTKRMQGDDADPANASEAELEAIGALSTRQRMILKLTEQVTEKSRGGS